MNQVFSTSEKNNAYRGLPGSVALALSFFASSLAACSAGLLAGIGAIYLYDRGESKGDDAAIGLGGFFAVGTFVFVVFFTWLQKVHHPISSTTPLYAFYASLLPAAVATLFLADAYFLGFMIVDWLFIVCFGLLSLFVCRRLHT
jgi:hypothetical protein